MLHLYVEEGCKDMIQCNQLYFRYPKNDFDTLKDICFSISKGEWVSIIGRNGSGKSTLIKVLNGLYFPYRGDILIDGVKIHTDNIWDIREKIGLVFQNPENQFVGTTVLDDVAFGMENYEIPRVEMLERIDWVLQEVGMSAYKHKAPQELSGGQKQRIALASALALKPQICTLDEAMVMLDPVSRQRMFELLLQLRDKYHMTIVSVTHDLTELNYSDRTFVLEEGKLIWDASSAEVLANKDFRMLHRLGKTSMDELSEALQAHKIPVQDTYMSQKAWVDDLWVLFSNR